MTERKPLLPKESQNTWVISGKSRKRAILHSKVGVSPGAGLGSGNWSGFGSAGSALMAPTRWPPTSCSFSAGAWGPQDFLIPSLDSLRQLTVASEQVWLWFPALTSNWGSSLSSFLVTKAHSWLFHINSFQWNFPIWINHFTLKSAALPRHNADSRTPAWKGHLLQPRNLYS